MTTKRKTTTRRRDAITPETPLRVALYTRRSTDDEHQPYTIEAQTAARAAKYDLLLVYRLDRFSRCIRDLATLMDELEDVGVHFRSATDPSTPPAPPDDCLCRCSARSPSSNAKSSSTG